MNAKELRIGNYITLIDRSNEIHIPTGVSYNVCAIGVFESKILRHGLNWAENEFKNVSNNDLSPIPLTEEWLLRLGYKSDKNEYFVSDLDRFNVFLTVKNTYMFCDCETAIKYIKYVHELQNIYFTLTGEELTIKE